MAIFSVSGRKRLSDYQRIFRNLTTVSELHIIWGSMAHAFFESSFLKHLCVLNECEMNVQRSRYKGACHVVPAFLEQSGCSSDPAWRNWGRARLLRLPEGYQVKGHHVPSEGKAKCSGGWGHRTGQDRLSQICDSRVFPSCWLDGVSHFHNVKGLGIGFIWCKNSLRVGMIQSEVSFFL